MGFRRKNIFYFLEKNAIEKSNDFYGDYIISDSILGITLKSSPKSHVKTISFIGEVNTVKSGNTLVSTRGKIYVSVYKSNRSNELKKGMTISVCSKVKPIVNHDESLFDFKEYMATKQVHYKVFANNQSWGSENKSKLYSMPIKISDFRNRLIFIFER